MNEKQAVEGTKLVQTLGGLFSWNKFLKYCCLHYSFISMPALWLKSFVYACSLISPQWAIDFFVQAAGPMKDFGKYYIFCLKVIP